jgi:hypothetical protein
MLKVTFGRTDCINDFTFSLISGEILQNVQKMMGDFGKIKKAQLFSDFFSAIGF